MKISLAKSDRRRGVAKEADVLLRNRFVEGNPVLNEEFALVQRPALRRWISVGAQPVRAMYQQSGTFDEDVFVVSGAKLLRVKNDETFETVSDFVFGADTNAHVSMACTGDVGDIGPRLWVADGQTLRVYMEDGFASARLSGDPAVGSVISMGGVYYRFVAEGADVDAGTPAGTAAAPWLVRWSPVLMQAKTNLYRAVGGFSEEGVTPSYSSLTVPNPQVAPEAVLSAYSVYRARAEGGLGNAIALTATGGTLAWDNPTMTDGGTPGFITVPMPRDLGVISVGFINGYIIIIPAQGQGVNGRFYWVEPGEVVVDELNYATAERSPDPIYQVVVFSDQFWLPGQNTTETWFTTGDPDLPMSRVQGVLFDRGTYPGTAIQVRDQMVIVDSDGGVFAIKGGAQRISTNDIEERIRKSFARQSFLAGNF